MTKQQLFIDFVDRLIENSKEEVIMSDEVREVYDALKGDTSTPLFTGLGEEILRYLQTCDSKNLKAKDIATGMDISSRKITGAIRKLVSDGFVDKFGTSPVVYTLTEKGKNFDLSTLKEK